MRRAWLVAVALALAACNDWESISAGHDAGPMLPAHCSSGVTDEDETDVDCGGACAPCDVALACTLPKDCQTRTCVDGRCTLTSDPPGWLKKVGQVDAWSGSLFTAGPDGRLYLLFASGPLDPPPAGPQNPLYAYDPDSAQWTQLAPLEGVTRMPYTAAFGPAGRLYVVCANSVDGSTEMRSYDPATNTWSVEAPLPTLRYDFAAAGDAEHLYVIGGYVPMGFTQMTRMDFEVYTAPQGQFTTKPLPASWQGQRSAATILDGLVYVLGESGTSTGLYDPMLDAWQAVTPMTSQRGYFSATVGADHRIYAIGGDNPLTVEAYDQHGWTPAAPAPYVGRNRSGRGRDGRIYSLGQRIGSGSYVYSYGPQLILTTATTPAGGTLQVSGSNFAARAIVSFSWDDDSTTVASAESDDTGVVLPVSVPAGIGTGPHRLRAMDDRSRYPVSVAVTIE